MDSPTAQGLSGSTVTLTVLLFLALLAGTATTATAQEVPTNASEAANATSSGESDDWDPDEECTERIDAIVSICSSSYENGQAVIEMYSTRPQRVVVTDAAVFMSGGEVERQAFHLDGRTTVEFPATEYQGYVGVSIDTGRVLYAEPIERGGGISSPYDSDLLALVTGLIVVPAGAVGTKKIRDRYRRKGVQRVDG